MNDYKEIEISEKDEHDPSYIPRKLNNSLEDIAFLTLSASFLGIFLATLAIIIISN